jgi:hypothetical protein
MKNRKRRRQEEAGGSRVSANFLVGAQNLGKFAETLLPPASSVVVKYY